MVLPASMPPEGKARKTHGEGTTGATAGRLESRPDLCLGGPVSLLQWSISMSRACRSLFRPRRLRKEGRFSAALPAPVNEPGGARRRTSPDAGVRARRPDLRVPGGAAGVGSRAVSRTLCALFQLFPDPRPASPTAGRSCRAPWPTMRPRSTRTRAGGGASSWRLCSTSSRSGWTRSWPTRCSSPTPATSGRCRSCPSQM